MEKERKITAPDGCEIEKVEIVDGAAVVTFKKKERKLPKSWEEFCAYYPVPLAFSLKQDPRAPVSSTQIDLVFMISEFAKDRKIAEAVLALLKLILLRDCYNGDFVPEWKGYCTNCRKHTIEFNGGEIETSRTESLSSSPLYFKTSDLRDEFLRNFRPLIEKLKPLYGIREEQYIKVEERGGKE